MFTNNYLALRKSLFLNSVVQLTKQNGTTRNNVPLEHFIYSDIGVAMHRGNFISEDSYTSYQNTYNNGVAFGTGSTPATKEDYKLESIVPFGALSFSNSNSVAVITKVSDGIYCATASYIVKNETDADINIYEIGYFGAVKDGSSSSSGYTGYLMERTVLTEPITIPAGQAKVVTYKITFNQTLNVE